MAQQAPIYSQYVLNEFIVNPSVAGIDGMTSINLTGRKQWIGVEHAPETYLVSASTRILKAPKTFKIERTRKKTRFRRPSKGRVGLGASIIKDRNGAVNRTGLNLSYAYHIHRLDDLFSLGFSFLIQQFNIDPDLAQFNISGFDLPDIEIDPAERFLGKSSYIPDAAFGINYSKVGLSMGLSVFHLFQSPVKFGSESINSKQLKQIRQYNLIGSYREVTASNYKWEYEPSVIIRFNEAMQFSADFSWRMIYNKEYWAGASIRTSGDFVLLMGIKFHKFYFGYSFDYGFNQISKQSYGSHEVLLAVKLGDSTRRYRFWERY